MEKIFSRLCWYIPKQISDPGTPLLRRRPIADMLTRNGRCLFYRSWYARKIITYPGTPLLRL